MNQNKNWQDRLNESRNGFYSGFPPYDIGWEKVFDAIEQEILQAQIECLENLWENRSIIKGSEWVRADDLFEKIRELERQLK